MMLKHLRELTSQEIPPTAYYFRELVLDLTRFNHPGGSKYLKHRQHQDISDYFQDIEHSYNARRMVAMHTIGIRSGYIGDPIAKTLLNHQTEQMIENVYNKVNIKQAILDQVQNLNKDQLKVFLQYPRFLKDTDTIRLSNNNFNEFLRQQNIFYNMSIFGIVFIVILYFAVSKCQTMFQIFVGLILATVASAIKWTAIQYYNHRIALHKQHTLKDDSPKELFRLIVVGHGIHHSFPNYRYLLVLNFYKILIYLVLFLMIYSLVFGIKYSLFIVLGTLAGLMSYDILHYFFHFGWEPTFPPIVALKKSHLKHHYKDSLKGFGVSSLIWDYIFGTMHINEKK